LSDIPSEIKQEIFLFLYLWETERVKLVCREFAKIIDRRLFYTQMLNRQSLEDKLPLCGELNIRTLTFPELTKYANLRCRVFDETSVEKIPEQKGHISKHLLRFQIHHSELYKKGVHTFSTCIRHRLLRCKCGFYIDFKLKDDVVTQKNTLKLPFQCAYCTHRITVDEKSTFIKLVTEVVKTERWVLLMKRYLEEWKQYFVKRGYVAGYSTGKMCWSFVVMINNCTSID